MRRLGASSSPSVVKYRWFAIYTYQGGEVYTQTTKRPPKKQTLRVPGAGRKKFKLHKLYRLPNDPQESEALMARKKASSKKKADVDEEIDELEGLEELEDDDEVEEPDVEEDDDDEEEKPKAKRRRKSASKKKAAGKKKKAKVVEEEDDEDEDEDEEDDDEEEDEPVVTKKSKKSKSAKKADKKKAGKKGGKKKDTVAKKSKSGDSAAGKTTKEMTGGVGTAELAEAASEIADVEITGRDVRVYLRKNEVEKDDEHGRYVWKSTNNKAFQKLAKAIAKEFAEEDDDE